MAPPMLKHEFADSLLPPSAPDWLTILTEVFPDATVLPYTLQTSRCNEDSFVDGRIVQISPDTVLYVEVHALWLPADHRLMMIRFTTKRSEYDACMAFIQACARHGGVETSNVMERILDDIERRPMRPLTERTEFVAVGESEPR